MTASLQTTTDLGLDEDPVEELVPYLRVSLDASGIQRSNNEQAEDHERATARRRWRLSDAPYSDIGSASRFRTKPRGDFNRLLADLWAGRFPGTILGLWEPSRGSRDTGEWVALIEACAFRRIRIFVTSHDHLYDPRKPRDRKSLLEDAIDSEYESAKTSERVKRDMASAARQGRTHGIVPYGYTRKRDPETGRPTGLEPHPIEADYVRRIFMRFHAGWSIRAIVAELREGGVPTRKSGPWVNTTVRGILSNPVYSGYRRHATREARREMPRSKAYAEATQYPGEWEPLVKRSVFLAIQNKLADPKRLKWRPGHGIHLLSNIGSCDTCGGPTSARMSAPRISGVRDRMYTCRDAGHFSMPADDVDRAVTKHLVAYLAAHGAKVLTSDDDSGEALTAANAELEKAKADWAKLVKAMSAGTMDPDLANESAPGIKARIADAERHIEELSVPSELRGILGEGGDIANRWDDAPMSAKRAVARRLLVVGRVGELRMGHNPKRGQATPVEARISYFEPGDLPVGVTTEIKALLPVNSRQVMAPEDQA